MDNEQEKLIRVLPMKEMFERDEERIERHTIPEGQLMTPTYRIDLPEGGGIHSWHIGDKYPHKAWPFKEAVYAMDTIKRLVMNGLSLIFSFPIRYVAALFVLLPRSLKRIIINNAIAQFVDYADLVFRRWGAIMQFTDDKENVFGLASVCMKPEFYCDMARELYRVGMKMAGDNLTHQYLVKIVCMFFENDDAYRYLVQDLFGLIDKQRMLKNPAKEFKYILDEALKRNTNKNGGIPKKVAILSKLLPILFYMRDFKKLVKEFFEEVDLDKVILDHIDFYRVLIWGGWNWAGMEEQERVSLRMMIDAEWVHGEDESVKLKNQHVTK